MVDSALEALFPGPVESGYEITSLQLKWRTRTMEQTVARLELPLPTYRLLEKMARARRVTTSELVSDLVRQFQTMESLDALRQEYQRLTDKALLRTITRREEKRLNAPGGQIEALSALSNRTSAQEQSDRKAEELIAASEKLLERPCAVVQRR